jgi:hypothetical protein
MVVVVMEVPLTVNSTPKQCLCSTNVGWTQLAYLCGSFPRENARRAHVGLSATWRREVNEAREARHAFQPSAPAAACICALNLANNKPAFVYFTAAA